MNIQTFPTLMQTNLQAFSFFPSHPINQPRNPFQLSHQNCMSFINPEQYYQIQQDAQPLINFRQPYPQLNSLPCQQTLFYPQSNNIPIPYLQQQPQTITEQAQRQMEPFQIINWSNQTPIQVIQPQLISQNSVSSQNYVHSFSEPEIKYRTHQLQLNNTEITYPKRNQSEGEQQKAEEKQKNSESSKTCQFRGIQIAQNTIHLENHSKSNDDFKEFINDNEQSYKTSQQRNDVQPTEVKISDIGESKEEFKPVNYYKLKRTQSENTIPLHFSVSEDEMEILRKLPNANIQNSFKNILKGFQYCVNKKFKCFFAYEDNSHASVIILDSPSSLERRTFLQKFNKFIKTKKYSHKCIKQIIENKLYSAALKHFSINYAQQWILGSSFQNKEEILLVLKYFALCVDNQHLLYFLSKLSERYID